MICTPAQVTTAGFIAFLRNTAGVPVSALPDDSDQIVTALCLAREVVNEVICQVAPQFYVLAVYNWATDYLCNWAMDTPPSTFFTDLRKKWDLTAFVPGLVASTADVSTSTSLMIPTSLQDLTLSDLQYLKTPFGRYYLSIAMKYGSIWGLT